MRVHKLPLATAVVLVAGISLTACTDGAAKGQGASPSSSTASASSGGGGQADASQGQGKDSAGQDSGGQSSGGQDSGGSDTEGNGSRGTSSSGQGAATGSGGSGKTAETGTTGEARDTGETGKAGKCRTDDLAITAMDNTIEGDPDGTVVVELNNEGGRDCVMSGYAGVDLKTNAGTLSAKRTGIQGTSVTLKSGKSVALAISYPVNKTGGSGIRITGLLVTPPNETKTVALAWPGAATLPVTEGPGSPVKVGPIGSAGQGG
ncbi:DUF4232 domain-containing protein [Streptomyces sp. NPDC056460]|uniref:DUF4232 domain-containing protein n=1 Tax=Streptomyces sp. NPDC056460 TaxID=3345825 RepID=UPI0036BF52BC